MILARYAQRLFMGRKENTRLDENRADVGNVSNPHQSVKRTTHISLRGRFCIKISILTPAMCLRFTHAPLVVLHRKTRTRTQIQLAGGGAQPHSTTKPKLSTAGAKRLLFHSYMLRTFFKAGERRPLSKVALHRYPPPPAPRARRG